MDFLLFLAFLCVFGTYFYGKSNELTFFETFQSFMVSLIIGVPIGSVIMLGFVYFISFFCIAGTCEPWGTFILSLSGGIYGAFAGFVIVLIVSVHNKFQTGIALIALTSFIVFPLGFVLGIELLDDFDGAVFMGLISAVFMGLISSVRVFYINSMIGSFNDTEKHKNDEKAKRY